MAAVRIEKLLKRYLDELNDETLREFQWQARLDGKIPLCKLQDVTREDTVDRLVQFHGEDEAASTTIKIFREINQNNLAQKLSQVISDRNTELEEQPTVSTVRPNQGDDFPIGPHDLSCTICLLLFNDPVVLQCGHSFCKICMHQEWIGKETWKCPLCQKVLPKTEPAINYNLRGLCESYREKNPAEPYQTPPTSIREKQGVSEKGKQFSDTTVAHMETPPTSIREKQGVSEKGKQFYETTVADMKVLPISTSINEKRNVFENLQQFSNHFVEDVKTQPLSKTISERPEAFERCQKSSDPFVERIEIPLTSLIEYQEVSEKEVEKVEEFYEKTAAHMKIPLTSLIEYQEVSEKVEQFYETTVADMKGWPIYTSINEKRNVFENVQQFSNHFVKHVKTQPLSKTIKERPEALEKCQKSSDPFVERIEKQACDAKKKIKDEFVQLHRLLRTKEKARLNALEREKRRKVCRLEKVAELSRGIAAALTDTLENSEDMGPDGEFTQNIRTRLERAHRELTDPQNHEPSQINVSEHVENLQSRVCRELLDTVEKS